ncbi:MAG: MFS transporter [Hyphomicrobiales bacterium]|nr:MFS transporter [Hyphomicrobiales bacterium]MCP5075357.1 MFS transporter [Paracoccaceae bacterium]
MNKRTVSWQPEIERGRRRSSGLAAWCFYDWANSAFPTVITTFIFASYFAQAVAPTPIEGTVLWSRALTFVGLTVAFASPLLGAVADHLGPRKPWIFIFSVVCCVLTALLWFVQPASEYLFLAVGLYIAASIAYQFAIVFYDAMLPSIAPRKMLGRISGWGWATGYVGGLLCLIACLWLVQSGGADTFGLDVGLAEPVRATSIFVGLWFAAFSLPLFLFTPDRVATGLNLAEAMGAGLHQLRGTFGLLRRNPPIARFLIAHMLYTDGLVTLFAFGGIYAAAEFGMEPADILVFGIVLNIAAGGGAAAFSWLDDAIGSKRTIILALAGLILSGLGLVLARADWLFWALAIMLGLFVGPAQAAGRSLMARLAPEGIETAMFGLYALAGKATAFIGPLILGLTVQWTGSQRVGLATVVVFLFLGCMVLLSVKEPPAKQ